MPKSGIAESWGRLISNFLRNCHIDFQSGCTSLHSHQQWIGVPLTLHPLQHRLSLVVLILAIQTDVRWYLRVISICISLMAKDADYFLKCLLAIWDSSVENSLFSSVPHSTVLNRCGESGQPVLFLILVKLLWVSFHLIWRWLSACCILLLLCLDTFLVSLISPGLLSWRDAFSCI